jgi:hypothetical protein
VDDAAHSQENACVDAHLARTDAAPTPLAFPLLPEPSAEALAAVRNTATYDEPYEVDEPLVSICIATFDRADLLVERCLASIRRQTYPNLQIVVVGDHCTDDTGRRLGAIRDDRIVFENLPVRGPYPREGQPRWHVAGTYAMNRGLTLADGHFVCHLDDDDEIVHTRIERMVRAAQTSRAEFLWHRFSWEVGDGQWKTLGGEEPLIRTITTGSIFYHRVLTSIPWDVRAYLQDEPGDWHRVRRILAVAPRREFVPDVLTLHYRERGQAHFAPIPGEEFLDDAE